MNSSWVIAILKVHFSFELKTEVSRFICTFYTFTKGPWGSLVILSAWGAGDPSSNLGGPTISTMIATRIDSKESMDFCDKKKKLFDQI